MSATGAEAILELIGGQKDVRNYLRGLEEGSESDQDARRAMLAAIESMPGAGIHPAMAAACPYLYGQACLLMCRLWSDAEDGAQASIARQLNGIILNLRYDPRNKEDENEVT